MSAVPARPAVEKVLLPHARTAARAARRVEVAERTLTVRPGTRKHLTAATEGAPLAVNVDVPNAPLGGRVLGVKVLALRFVHA